MGDITETCEVRPPAPFAMSFEKKTDAKNIASLTMIFDAREISSKYGADLFGMAVLKMKFSSMARFQYGEQVAGVHELTMKEKGFFRRKIIVSGTLHA